jgi:hypothetical protein
MNNCIIALCLGMVNIICFFGEKVDFFSLFLSKFSWFFSRFLSEKVAFLVYFFASPISFFF